MRPTRSEKDQNALDQLRSTFEAGISSLLYLEWYDRAYECESFHEGRQWTYEEVEKVKNQYGVPAVTINKIASRIRNALGQEIQTRTKVVYRSRSGKKEEEETATALSDLAYFFQDTNRSPYVLSTAARHMLIGGIGFHEFIVKDGTIREDAPNPLTVVWDATDSSTDLTEQNFNFRMEWLTRDQLKARFPDKKDEIDNLVMDGAAIDGSIWPREDVGRWFTLRTMKSYYDNKFDKMCVVRGYYREVAKYYVCQTNDDRIVTTFSKSEAEKISKKGEPPIERDGYRVMCGYFCGNVLLKHYEYAYQMNPQCGWLPITPVVAEREATSGIPYGVVYHAIDAQKLRNKTETRLNWYMSAGQVIADADNGISADDLRNEANRPDGVLLKKSGTDLRIERHESRVQTHLARLQVLDQAIQDSMGIYDEALGMETNASSGVAIQRRQTGATRNLAMYFDKLRQARLTWGQKLLPLIQQVMDGRRVFYITDDENKQRAVTINSPVLGPDGKPINGENGKPIVKADIKTGEYDVYLEEVPDFSTQDDEWRDRILKIIEKYGPQVLAQPAMLKAIAKMAGVPQMALDSILRDIGAESPQQPEQQFDGANPANGGQGGVTQSLPMGGLPNIGR